MTARYPTKAAILEDARRLTVRRRALLVELETNRARLTTVMAHQRPGETPQALADALADAHDALTTAIALVLEPERHAR